LVPDLNLNDGNRLPQLGFGVFQIPEAETAEAVGNALKAGYRSIDTAAAYGNEAGVRDAVLTSELDRGDLFITTKLRNRDHELELRRFHEEHGIATEAWSPLGKGQFLDDPTIQRIASAHGRTRAQVVLRWQIQLGNVVIPKSVTQTRIEENFNLFDFELSDDDMHALFELDREERTGPDPDTFG
jgi:diketogulonate reductase-like aldo/keto reductase